MTDLLTLHKYFLSQHLRRGGVAVDFTMGNGHDTQYLCNAVYGGEDAPGKVYAFDIPRGCCARAARPRIIRSSALHTTALRSLFTSRSTRECSISDGCPVRTKR